MEEKEIGCARPTGAMVGGEIQEEALDKVEEKKAEVKESMTVMVGRHAPDFEAPAYYQGKFVKVKLSEFLGKWVLLCFYPGDFTFV
ncbi:MAG: redoxin domain-containing protein [Thermovirga sp.]|nr:redoxin domain-containing protein [Thermovirga sp.]